MRRWNSRRSTTSASRTGEAWETGLANLPDAQQARNIVLSDEEVRAFVVSAYASMTFGLFADTMAVTGARPIAAFAAARRGFARSSGAAKIDDAEVRKRRRTKSCAEENRVLFGADHSAACFRLKWRLRAARDAPLLVQSDGSPWDKIRVNAIIVKLDKVVSAIGIDPEVTIYSLRHTSIVRMLLKTFRSG